MKTRQSEISKISKISKDDYYKLIGLKSITDDLNNKLKDIEESCLSITQELDYDGTSIGAYGGGYTGNYVYDSTIDVKTLLKNLGIKIKKDKSKT